MARTSSYNNVGSVVRASKAWDDGWNGVSGGAVGTLVEYAANTVRDGVNGALVGEGTTNEVRNPRAEGGTDGDLSGAGALPTYWQDNGSRLSAAGAAVAYGTEGGREYMDLIFSSDTPTASPLVLYFEENNRVVAADGEDWTIGVDLKLVSGDFTNVDAIMLVHSERTGAGSGVAAEASSDFKGSIDSTARRFWFYHQLDGGGTTARLWSGLRLEHTSGAWTFTLRVYMPQMEQNPYATSIVLPNAASPAASTRAIDAGQITLANGAWNNEDGAGSLYVDMQMRNVPASGSPRILAFGSDANNVVEFFADQSGGTYNVRGEDGGVTQWSITGGAYAAGASAKLAVAWAVNDVHASLAGTTGDDTAASIAFGASLFTIGGAIGGGTSWQGEFYLKNVEYRPVALTDAQINAQGSA